MAHIENVTGLPDDAFYPVLSWVNIRESGEGVLASYKDREEVVTPTVAAELARVRDAIRLESLGIKTTMKDEILSKAV